MVNERPQKIDGMGRIVQIDESLFSKRKYNVGEICQRVEVVGGIDTKTEELFLLKFCNVMQKL